MVDYKDYPAYVTQPFGDVSAEPEPPRQTGGQWLGDTVKDLAKGAIDVGTSAFAATGNKRMTDLGNDINWEIEQSKSKRGQYVAEHPEADKGGIADTIVQAAMGFLPYVPVGIGAEAAGAAAAPFTAGVSAAAVPAATFAGLTYGSMRSKVRDAILHMPQTDIEQSPKYQQYLKETGSDQAAREKLYDESDELLPGLIAGGAGAIGGGIATKVFGKLGSEAASRAITNRILGRMGGQLGPAAIEAADVAVPSWLKRAGIGAGEAYGAGVAQIGGEDYATQMEKYRAGIGPEPDMLKTTGQALRAAAPFTLAGLSGRPSGAARFRAKVAAAERGRREAPPIGTEQQDALTDQLDRTQQPPDQQEPPEIPAETPPGLPSKPGPAAPQPAMPVGEEGHPEAPPVPAGAPGFEPAQPPREPAQPAGPGADIGDWSNLPPVPPMEMPPTRKVHPEAGVQGILPPEPRTAIPPSDLPEAQRRWKQRFREEPAQPAAPERRPEDLSGAQAAGYAELARRQPARPPEPMDLQTYTKRRDEQRALGDEIERRQQALDDQARDESGHTDRDELDDYIAEHDHLRQEHDAIQKGIARWEQMGDEVAGLRQDVIDRRRREAGQPVAERGVTAAGKGKAKVKAAAEKKAARLTEEQAAGLSGREVMERLGVTPHEAGRGEERVLPEAASDQAPPILRGTEAQRLAAEAKLKEPLRKVAVGKAQGMDEALWEQAKRIVLAQFKQRGRDFTAADVPKETHANWRREYYHQVLQHYLKEFRSKYPPRRTVEVGAIKTEGAAAEVIRAAREAQRQRAGEAAATPERDQLVSMLKEARDKGEDPAWIKEIENEITAIDRKGGTLPRGGPVEGVGPKGRAAVEKAKAGEQRRKEAAEKVEQAISGYAQRETEREREHGLMRAIAGTVGAKIKQVAENVGRQTGRFRKQDRMRREYVEVDNIAREAVQHPDHALDADTLDSALARLGTEKHTLPTIPRLHEATKVLLDSVEARIKAAQDAVEKWRYNLTASGMKPSIRFGIQNRSANGLWRNVLVHYNDFRNEAKRLMEKGVDGRKELTKLLGDFYYKERQLLEGDILGFNKLEGIEKETMRDMYSAAIVRGREAKEGEEGHLSRDEIGGLEEIEAALNDSIEQDEEAASARGAEQARLAALTPEQRQTEAERKAIAEQGLYARGRVPWALREHSVFGTKSSPLLYARLMLNEMVPQAAGRHRDEQIQIIRGQLADLAKQRDIQRQRDDLAAQQREGEAAAKQEQARIARGREQAEIEGLSPDEQRARELRQQEGEHYGRLAYDRAIERGLSRDEAQAVGLTEQRAYHELSGDDKRLLSDYATGHVSSLFDTLGIHQKVEFQRRLEADYAERAKAAAKGPEAQKNWVAKFMASRGAMLSDRMAQLWKATNLVRPDLELTTRAKPKATPGELEAQRRKLWQIHQEMRRAMGEAVEPFDVRDNLISKPTGEKILRAIHADFARASAEMEQIDTTMRLHWEALGKLDNLPEYGLRGLLDPTSDLGKPALLPKGAAVTKVRDQFGPTSSTYGLQGAIRSPRAALVRHFMQVANKLVGHLDVVHLTGEQMGLAAQERDLPATVRAFYDPKSDRIFITHEAFNSADRGQLMMHEVAHALTESALQRFPAVVQRMEEIRRRVKAAFNNPTDPAHERVRGLLEGDDHGLQNVHEFISEFWANDKYADALDALNSTEKEQKRWKTGERGQAVLDKMGAQVAAERQELARRGILGRTVMEAGDEGLERKTGDETLLRQMVKTLRSALKKMFDTGSEKRMLNDATVHALDMLQRLEDKGRPRPIISDESAARATTGVAPNPVRGSFFHGTPFRWTGEAPDSDVMWVTPNRRAASEYASEPMMGAQRGERERAPHVRFVPVNARNVFDMRKPEHRALFDEIRAESRRSADPDDHIRKTDLENRDGLPSFGTVSEARSYLEARGFDGMWASEGSQGPSLALFRPREDWSTGQARPAPPVAEARPEMAGHARGAMAERFGNWGEKIGNIVDSMTKLGTFRNLAHRVERFDPNLGELFHTVIDKLGKTDREQQRIAQEVDAPLLRRVAKALNMGDPKIINTRMADYVNAENYAKAVGNEKIGEGANKWIDPNNPEHLQHIERHKKVEAMWNLPEEQGGFNKEQKQTILDLRKALADRHEAMGRASFEDIIGSTNLLHEQTPEAVDAALKLARGEKLTPEDEAELQKQVTDKDSFDKKIKEWKRAIPWLRKLQGVFYPMMRHGDYMVHGTYDVAKLADDNKIGYDKNQSPEPVEDGRALKFRFTDEAQRDRFIKFFANHPDYDFHITAAGKEAADKTPYAVVNNMHFSGHESARAAQQALNVLRESPYFRSGGPSVRRDRLGAGGSPLRQLQGLNDLVEGMKNSSYFRARSPDEQRQITNELYEQSVRHLLSDSARSRYLERRYTKGASGDLLDNTYKYLHNTSYTLAELRLRPEMRAAVKAVDDYVDQAQIKEPVSGVDLPLSDAYNLNRSKARRDMHERLATRPLPHNSTWLDKATNDVIKATSLAKLGGISFHILNSTEPIMLALPHLAGEVGDFKAANYMRRAYALYGFDRAVDMGSDVWKVLTKGLNGVEGLSNHLESIDKRVQGETDGKFLAEGIKFLADTGYLNRDAGFDVARHFEPGQKSLGRKVFDWTDGLSRAVGAAVESENRVITATAALWAFRDKHPEWSDHQVFRAAQQLVEKSAGNYAWYNKPGWMQSSHPLVRMATQFKNYPLRVTQNYMLMTLGAYRHMMNRDEGNPAAQEANRVLARQLARQTVLQATVTGMFGTAIWGPIGAAFSASSPIFGVNSDKAEDYTRAALADIVGPDWASFITRGGLRALGSEFGGGIGERLSHSNLWFNGAAGEKVDDWNTALGKIVGGAGVDTIFHGIHGVADIATGLRRAADGQETAGQAQAWHGLAEAIPVKAIADGIKTMSNLFLGEHTPGGAPKAPEPDVAQVVSNFMGLRTGRQAERQEQTGAFMRAKKDEADKVSELKHGYAMASPEERQALRGNLKFYNEKLSPGSRLTVMDLENYRRTYEKAQKTPAEQGGQTLTRRTRPLWEQVSSAYTQ